MYQDVKNRGILAGVQGDMGIMKKEQQNICVNIIDYPWVFKMLGGWMTHLLSETVLDVCQVVGKTKIFGENQNIWEKLNGVNRYLKCQNVDTCWLW